MKKKPGSGRQQTPQEVRLNKFIANTGLCSRREADTLIQSGYIQVNGKTVTELGTRVGPQDVVTHKGKRLQGEKKVYVLLNKPKDTLTTAKDTHGRKTVMDLVRACCPERIYPVGRLDRNTTGVLLLTNDGAMAEALTHPSYNRRKVYHVFLDKNLKTGDLAKISEGIELEDGFIRPDSIHYTEKKDKRQIGMEIHSGKNRIVRRIFEQLDYRIEKLDRVYFAGLTKKGVSRGHWRFLTTREIAMLKMSIPGKSRKKPSPGKSG